MSETAEIRILFNNNTFIVPVFPKTTLLQIIMYINMDPLEFEEDGYVFVNDGNTPMPNLEQNMLYYNNWYIDNGYIPSLHIKSKSSMI